MRIALFALLVTSSAYAVCELPEEFRDRTRPDTQVTPRERAEPKLTDMRPTQTHIGKENVLRTAASMRKDMGTQSVLDYVRSHFANSPLPAVRGRDGKYYLTDGHHRTSALALICKERGVPNRKCRMPLVIVKDCKAEKLSQEQCAKWMKDENKLYFAPDTVAKAQVRFGNKATPARIMDKYIPEKFLELTDRPMRSAVGNVLYSYQSKAEELNKTLPENERIPFSADNWLEYIEFLVGDHLAEPPFNIRITDQYNRDDEAGLRYRKEVERKIEDALYNDVAWLATRFRRMVGWEADPYRKAQTDQNQCEVGAQLEWMKQEYERRYPRDVRPAESPADSAADVAQ